jgi:hypothetical protein
MGLPEPPPFPRPGRNLPWRPGQGWREVHRVTDAGRQPRRLAQPAPSWWAAPGRRSLRRRRPRRARRPQERHAGGLMRDARHRVGACEYRGRGRTWGLRQRLLDAPCLAWKVSATADSLPQARTQERPQKVHLPKAAKRRIFAWPTAGRSLYLSAADDGVSGRCGSATQGRRTCAGAPVRHGTTQVAVQPISWARLAGRLACRLSAVQPCGARAWLVAHLSA